MTKHFDNPEQALAFLAEQGQGEDSAINLVECALAFSYLDTPEKDLSSYRAHIIDLKKALKDSFDELACRLNGDSANVRVQSLKEVITNQNGYDGDRLTYDDFANINLFNVIDRRQGMPITLSILAIDLARSMGWVADGVNFPGHFFMRLEYDGERIMTDPFEAFRVFEAKDLRILLKRTNGERAELSAEYYNACSNRDTLLRYQNNLKFRLIEQGRYQQALDIIKRMALIAPKDHRLCLDKAVLLARLEQPRAAIEALTIYLNYTTNPQDRAEAQAFLYELQRQLN